MRMIKNMLKSDRKEKRIGNKVVRLLGLCILLAIFQTACSWTQIEPEQVSETAIQVYYLSKDETSLVYQWYEPVSEDPEIRLEELINRMKTVPEKVDMKAPLLYGFDLLDYYIEGGQAVIIVGEEYRQLSPSTEILVRAAIVRTVTQIDGVNYVSMMVGADPLTDAKGNPVGVMTAEMFIDNEGSEINAYEQKTFRLYFANASGDGLVEVNQLVVYNSNISMERIIVEQLIAGPTNTETYPVINPDTGINSITIADGICYVNLNEQFLIQTNNVKPEVSIYAIVNSLVEISNVNKVQIMVNGETNVMYQESLSLETIYERNLDLIQ